jgi:hypothetical protein
MLRNQLIYKVMGATVLKRKKMRRWIGQQRKVERISHLNSKPVLKSIDVQAIKDEFKKKKAQSN